MKNIWKVDIHFEEKIKNDVIEDWLSFNVEAIDDIGARKRGIKLAIGEGGEDIHILYAEIKHVLEFE